MRKRTAIVIGLIILFYAGYYFLRMKPVPAESHSDNAKVTSVNRIVSMAPSITETLFALGLGERVVGVTKFCDYPAEARKIKKIGGYVDANYETIAMLKPDLAIILPEHKRATAFFDEFRIKSLTVKHATINDLFESIAKVGRTCGKGNAADSLVALLKSKVSKVKQSTLGKSRPSVLVAIGRNMGSGSLEDLYIAGNDGFYSELIHLAGGKNTYTDSLVRFPIVTMEGVIQMNPDIIIDIVPDLKERGWNAEKVKKEWSYAGVVNAVKKGRIHVMGEDYVAVPGPRFILILEDFARIIHPITNRERSE